MTLRNLPLGLLLCGLALLPSVVIASDVQLDTPVGGWHSGAQGNERFQQAVHYPASSVNTPEGQSDSARIRGVIRNTPKADPGKLIVNGVNMPLKLDEKGGFDRPYIFPAGSNSVEVRSPDGQQKHRVQFYSTGGSAAPAKLRILLSWDTDRTDLDLHVITPDGEHIWYGHRGAPNGGALDVDVTTGYGPEIFSMPSPLRGQYLIYVNYFGGGMSASEDEGGNTREDAVQPLTTAQVTLITEEGTPSEKVESFIVPMRQPGELTLVKRFSYP